MNKVEKEQVPVPQRTFKDSLKETGVVRGSIAFLLVIGVGALGVYGEVKLAEQDTQIPADVIPDAGETEDILDGERETEEVTENHVE